MKKYLSLALKIAVFLSGTMTLLILFMTPIVLVFNDMEHNPTYMMIVQELLMIVAVLLLSYLILHFWEKLPMAHLGLGLKDRFKDIGYGALTAAALYAIGFVILLVFGWISIEKVALHPTDLLTSLFLMVLVGICEETMCRGFILGRMLHAGIHPWLALLLSSLIFSFMHIFNDGFSTLAFINITLAGILLGVAYVTTHNLWFSISLHAFWNWIQGQLGFAVSGQDLGEPLISINLTENTLMNGGNFGFENSLVCTLLMIFFIYLIHRYISPKLNINSNYKTIEQ